MVFKGAENEPVNTTQLRTDVVSGLIPAFFSFRNARFLQNKRVHSGWQSKSNSYLQNNNGQFHVDQENRLVTGHFNVVKGKWSNFVLAEDYFVAETHHHRSAEYSNSQTLNRLTLQRNRLKNMEMRGLKENTQFILMKFMLILVKY